MRYFKITEFACQGQNCCGGAAAMSEAFLADVDELRHRFGKPLRVTSGYRCANHNQKVSTTGATGPHTTGQAADFAVSGADAYELVKLAFEMGFTGIGINQKGNSRFVHVDRLPDTAGRPRVWSY